MKFVQFGLCYSPNVGDGIIAECLAHGLRARAPGAEVRTVDISGRRDFGAVTVRNRATVLRLLRVLPAGTRRALVRWRLERMLDRAEPEWRAAAEGADLAILGGGQLFSDADLNFCIKVARVARVVKEVGVPLAVHAVGASRNWSEAGRALFSEICAARLVAVSLRDLPSAEAWTLQMGPCGPEPVLARDPGLLAASCYGPAPQPSGRIGLCVAAPEILSYHADGAVAGAAGLPFFRDIALALCAGGHAVTLFCNGAEEDRRALAALAARPELANHVAAGRIMVAPPPETPAALARCIAALGGVIAHRLHACIVAYAYGLPVIGLGWDRKVESFLASVGADAWFVGAASASGQDVAMRLEAALADGVDGARHAAALRECWDAMDALVGFASARQPGASERRMR